MGIRIQAQIGGGGWGRTPLSSTNSVKMDATLFTTPPSTIVVHAPTLVKLLGQPQVSIFAYTYTRTLHNLYIDSGFRNNNNF